MNARRIANTGPKEAPAQAGRGRVVKPDAKVPPLHAAQAREELLSRPITMLRLDGLYHNTARVCMSQLQQNGVSTIGDLLSLGEDGLSRIPYARGEAFTAALKKELASMGLALGPAMNAGERKTLVERLATDLREMELPPGVEKVLEHSDIRYAYQLVTKSPRELIRMHFCSRRAFNSIREMLERIGLKLEMHLDQGVLADAMLVSTLNTGSPPAPATQQHAHLSSPRAPSQTVRSAPRGEQAQISVVFLRPVRELAPLAEASDVELKGLIGVVSGDAMLHMAKLVNMLKDLSSKDDGSLQLGVVSVNEPGKALVKSCPDVKPVGGFRRLHMLALVEWAILERHLRPEALKQTGALFDKLAYD